MMIQMISTGEIGKTDCPDLSLNTRPIRSVRARATFSARRCNTNFWMLSKIRRPSSMPLMIDAKLSSVRTSSEASLATSEPDCPIAIPTSALLRLGESFTPSPVILYS